MILLPQVERWFFALNRDAMASVTGAIDLLEMEGPTLGRPVVDKVNEMRDAVLAHRLAEIRKALGHARQADVAALMGVSQARVSKLESGDLSHTELGTLQAYVAALGGHLRIVAEFGENTVELTA